MKVPLTCQKLYKKIDVTIKKIKNVSLQRKLKSEPCENNLENKKVIDNQRKNIICGKVKASLYASDQKGLLKGVMTVEAALISWIFFMLVISLTSVMQVAYIYGAVQQDLILAAKQTCVMTATIGGGTEQLYLLGIAQKNNASDCYTWIQGGKAGISLIGSSVKKEDGTVLMCASYKVKPQLMYLTNITIPVKHHILMKAWTGYHQETQDGEAVEQRQVYYVTDYESVYHTSAQCSYLRVSVRLVDYEAAINSVNSSGHRYVACLQCHAAGQTGQVLITDSGEKYHSTLGCSALKRSVHEVYDVAQLKPCSRCGG